MSLATFADEIVEPRASRVFARSALEYGQEPRLPVLDTAVFTVSVLQTGRTAAGLLPPQAAISKLHTTARPSKLKLRAVMLGGFGAAPARDERGFENGTRHTAPQPATRARLRRRQTAIAISASTWATSGDGGREDTGRDEPARRNRRLNQHAAHHHSGTAVDHQTTAGRQTHRSSKFLSRNRSSLGDWYPAFGNCLRHGVLLGPAGDPPAPCQTREGLCYRARRWLGRKFPPCRPCSDGQATSASGNARSKRQLIRLCGGRPRAWSFATKEVSRSDFELRRRGVAEHVLERDGARTPSRPGVLLDGPQLMAIAARS